MRDELLRGNERYAKAFAAAAATGARGLGPEPAKRLAVVTCMDTRLDVYAMLGLQLGDAHVIRNAGGRVTDDVLRSLIVSVEILGTDTVAVIQHTDCGMAKVTNKELRDLLHERRQVDTSAIDFLAIDDHADALRNDVEFLEASPLLPDHVEVFAFLYDVHSGRLTPVESPALPEKS